MRKKLLPVLFFVLLCSGCGGERTALESAETAAPAETALPETAAEENTASPLPVEVLWPSVEEGDGWACYYKEEPLEDGLHHWDTLNYVLTENYDCIRITVQNDSKDPVRVTTYLDSEVQEESVHIPAGETGTAWVLSPLTDKCYLTVIGTAAGEELSGWVTITAGTFEALGYGDAITQPEGISTVEQSKDLVCFYENCIIQDNSNHYWPLVYEPEESYDCIKITVKNESEGRLHVINYRGNVEKEAIGDVYLEPQEEGTLWITDVEPGLTYNTGLLTANGEKLGAIATVTAGTFEALGYPGEKEN